MILPPGALRKGRVILVSFFHTYLYALPVERTGSQRRRRGATRSRHRVQEERAALYRRLTAEAAERIFARKGSGASRMQEVADEAGLSLATIYGVVQGKEDLIAAIHQERMRECLDRIRAARESCSDTLAAHLAVLLASSDFFIERPAFLRMCCRDGYGWASGTTTSEAGARFWREGIAIPTELFRRGIAQRLYVDEPPELLARKMLALQQVELTHWAEGGMRADPSQVRARLRSQFLRAFLRPGAPARKIGKPRRGR